MYILLPETGAELDAAAWCSVGRIISDEWLYQYALYYDADAETPGAGNDFTKGISLVASALVCWYGLYSSETVSTMAGSQHHP